MFYYIYILYAEVVFFERETYVWWVHISWNITWFFILESNEIGHTFENQRVKAITEDKSDQMISQGLIEILGRMTDCILERNMISYSLKLFTTKYLKEIIENYSKRWMSETLEMHMVLD